MKIYRYIALLNETGNPYLEKDRPYQIDGRKVYTSPDMLVDFIKADLGIHRCAEEHVYVLCLDNRGHMIGCFEGSHGTVNLSLISPREIFQKALLIVAVSIILTHNHPGNNSAPSKEDIAATKRVKEAGEIIGIKLLDHIIVTMDGYTSMRENNLM